MKDKLLIDKNLGIELSNTLNTFQTTIANLNAQLANMRYSLSEYLKKAELETNKFVEEQKILSTEDTKKRKKKKSEPINNNA